MIVPSRNSMKKHCGGKSLDISVSSVVSADVRRRVSYSNNPTLIWFQLNGSKSAQGEQSSTAIKISGHSSWLFASPPLCGAQGRA